MFHDLFTKKETMRRYILFGMTLSLLTALPASLYAQDDEQEEVEVSAPVSLFIE